MRHPFWKSALVGVGVVASLLIPRASHAAGDDKLEHIILEISRLYDELEYERAFDLIQRARSLPHGVDGEVTLLLYEGMLLCEMGRFASAQQAFHGAFMMRPDVVLPEEVPPKVKKYFEATRLEVSRGRSGPSGPLASATRASPAQQFPRDADVAAEGVVLMKRLASLFARLRGMGSSADPTSRQELNAIEKQIKEAKAKEELEDASFAMDFWEARYLPPVKVKQ